MHEVDRVSVIVDLILVWLSENNLLFDGKSSTTFGNCTFRRS